MDLELATTRDILEELHRRGTHFVFAGFQPTNARSGEMLFASQAFSRGEVRQLIQVLQQCLRTRNGQGPWS